VAGFKLINLWQSKQERQEKYHLARSLGMNVAWATVMRDWRLAKIERLFGLTEASVEPQQPGLSVLLSREVDGIGGKKYLRTVDLDLRGSDV